MFFGDRLRARRLELKMTQPQLAKAVGVTKGAISGLEIGSSKKPNSPNLLRLANALFTYPEWLDAEKGEKNKLSEVQARVKDAMDASEMTPFDLVAACDGRLAVETVDLWLFGAANPTNDQLEWIAEPLGTNAIKLKTGVDSAMERPVRIIYDARGDPIPENLSQVEIDIIKDFRCMNKSDRESVHNIIRTMADAARSQRQKKDQRFA